MNNDKVGMEPFSLPVHESNISLGQRQSTKCIWFLFHYSKHNGNINNSLTSVLHLINDSPCCMLNGLKVWTASVGVLSHFLGNKSGQCM